MIYTFAVALVVVILTPEPISVFKVVFAVTFKITVDKISYVLVPAVEVVSTETVTFAVAILTFVASSAFVSKHALAVGIAVCIDFTRVSTCIVGKCCSFASA